MGGQWSDESYADIDPGIRSAVRALREQGVETFESCEGGGKHAYPEPTVRFYGDHGAGWHALSVMLTLGLPVGDLRRTWPCYDGVPHGPYWEVTLNRKLDERDLRPGETWHPETVEWLREREADQ